MQSGADDHGMRTTKRRRAAEGVRHGQHGSEQQHAKTIHFSVSVVDLAVTTEDPKDPLSSFSLVNASASRGAGGKLRFHKAR